MILSENRFTLFRIMPWPQNAKRPDFGPAAWAKHHSGIPRKARMPGFPAASLAYFLSAFFAFFAFFLAMAAILGSS